jgi:glycosyltransferase involved in cell wall biosynthesis
VSVSGAAIGPDVGLEDSGRAQADDHAVVASILLIAFNQQDTVGQAIAAALAQTFTPLEILISDDASGDDTWSEIQRAVAGYNGPHRVVLNRNPVNLGIGAHLSHLVAVSQGELLFVAAGDDVSVPQRCERVVATWLDSNKRLDLIASTLVDMDEQGGVHQIITPSDLASYRNAADWLARPPHVVGAAQAWTRRLFKRFGPLPQGVVAEDLIMVFRAIVSGGATTLNEPLVRYRRGGISRRRRALHASEVVERLLKNNRHALVELPQLLADAQVAGQLDAVRNELNQRLARERHIQQLFRATGMLDKLALSMRTTDIPLPLRLRWLMYAAFPWIAAPFFALKRLVANRL